ncbi:MAG: L,D-transpeptidase family protein [Candidatus Omnitrophota bacterium]
MRRVVIVSVVAAIIVFSAVFMVLRSRKPKAERKNEPVVTGDIKDAQAAYERGDLLGSRKLYKDGLESIRDTQELTQVRKRVEEINMKLLFSPVIDECSISYVVKPKDVLSKIAKKFNTTVNLIKRSNNLASNMIRPDQELKIYTCQFSIAIDKSQNLLFLKKGEEIFKTYTVATGKDNVTPVGNFKIINKLYDPTWFKAGAVIPPDSPDNVLGSRWMGFDIKGYGIHGTTEPESIGTHSTLGCVRMINEEAEEVFDIVPIGTEVAIVE